MKVTEEHAREVLVSLINQLAPEGATFTGEAEANLVEDLGYHSLALLELAFAIEDDFDLPPIDEETGRGIKTTEDVIGYVLGQLRDQGDLVEVGAGADPAS